jgi:aminoglycoside phosphotransferase
VLLWALALLLPHAPWGSVSAHLRPVPLSGWGHLRSSRTRSGPQRTARASPSDHTVLGYARATTFGAGTNLKGASAGAAWTFLLPSLELGLVLCVGAPSSATLRTLSRLADEVVVVGPGLPRVLPARRPDLVLMSGRRAVAAVGADAELAAMLRAAPMAFLDLPGGGEPDVASARLRPGCPLRLTPGAGDAHSAAAEVDGPTLAWLERSARAGHRSRARSLLKRRSEGSRRAVLVAPGVSPGGLRPPAYIRDIARGAGLVLDNHRAGLIAPGDYPSRKGVMFLFAGTDPKPDLVVKLVREPRHDARLENEWRALTWLQQAGLPGVLPRPAFIGRHAGLAVLGQSAVAGKPFHSRTSARPECPLARAALNWLLELGAATAHPVADNSQVVGAIRELAGRFEALYRLTGAQRARLEHHIDALGFAAAPFPLVFQHGDPSTGNLLVTDQGCPAFLDWEAAELDGMPLWDVFYFVRSFAMTVGRAGGVRSSLATVRRELLRDRPTSRILAGAVERHCSEIGLERALVEPLFVTCWMHRALKEATRLPQDRLDSGHYVNLVRLSLDRADAPGLQLLFSPAASVAAGLG